MTALATSAALSPSASALPEDVLLSMISNMEKLSALYEIELDAIEVRDMKRFSDIQPEKNRLVQDCEARMSEISKYQSQLKTINPVIKDRVVSAEIYLRDLATKSQRACQIRAESVRRVQERLLAAARYILSQESQPLYNNLGKTGSSKNKPTATAINEAI